MGEFENDDKNNKEFRTPSTETQTPKVEDKAEVDPESRIGKPDESREATSQEKSEAQRVLVEKIQKRVDGMKADLSKMEEMYPAVKSVETNTQQADKKEAELITLIRDQLQSGQEGYEENIKEQERIQTEITELRRQADDTRKEVFSKLPNGQRDTTELNQKIYNLKEDIAKEEDILEANKKELAKMSK